MFFLIPVSFKMALIQQLTLFSFPYLPSFTIAPISKKVYYSLDKTFWEMNLDGTEKAKLGNGSWPVVNEDRRKLAFVQENNLFQMDLETGQILFLSPASSYPRYRQNAIYFLTRSGFFSHLWFYEEENVGVGTPLTDLESPETVLYFSFSPRGDIFYTRAPYDVLAEKVVTAKTATYIYGEKEKIFLPEGAGGNIAPSPSSEDWLYVSQVLTQPCLYLHRSARKEDILVECGQAYSFSDPSYPFYALEPAFFSEDGFFVWSHSKKDGYYLTMYHHDGQPFGHIFHSSSPLFFIKAHPEKEGIYFLEENIIEGSKKVALFLARFIQVSVNGQRVTFDGSWPVIKGGALYVPITALSEPLSFTWSWEAKEKKAVGLHPSAFIELFPSKNEAVVNGEVKKVSLPVLEGRQYIPLALLVQAIGGTMDWKPKLALAEVLWRAKEE